jgi:hypothetical protein
MAVRRIQRLVFALEMSRSRRQSCLNSVSLRVDMRIRFSRSRQQERLATLKRGIDRDDGDAGPTFENPTLFGPLRLEKDNY